MAATKRRGRLLKKGKKPVIIKILTILLPISLPPALKRAIEDNEIPINTSKALKELAVIIKKRDIDPYLGRNIVIINYIINYKALLL